MPRRGLAHQARPPGLLRAQAPACRATAGRTARWSLRLQLHQSCVTQGFSNLTEGRMPGSVRWRPFGGAVAPAARALPLSPEFVPCCSSFSRVRCLRVRRDRKSEGGSSRTNTSAAMSLTTSNVAGLSVSQPPPILRLPRFALASGTPSNPVCWSSRQAPD